jgi:hypothetical protein
LAAAVPYVWVTKGQSWEAESTISLVVSMLPSSLKGGDNETTWPGAEAPHLWPQRNRQLGGRHLRALCSEDTPPPSAPLGFSTMAFHTGV